MQRLVNATILTAFLSCAVFGCGDDGAEPDPIPAEGPEGSWLVAIYMAADNNLDAMASRDLIELTEHGPPEGVDLTANRPRWDSCRKARLGRQTIP